MNQKLLTACVAALALSACNRSTSSSSSPSATAPVTVSPPVSAVTPAPLPTPVPVAEPQDPLALPSEGRDLADHLARARQLQNDGDLPGALAESRRALSHVANDGEALILVARLAQRTGDSTLAAEAYGRLATVDVADTASLVQQARLLVKLGRHGEALSVAKQAQLRDPQNPDVYQVMGRAHLSAGDLPLAIASFEQVLELDPEHGYAMNNLGLAYLRANENEKAVEILARATERLPLVAYVFNNYGVALERTGRKDEARAAFREATDLAPRYVKALINTQRLSNIAAATTEASPDSGEESAPVEETNPEVTE